MYISTELEEIIRLSDRIEFIYSAKLVAIVDATSATVEQIGFLMIGGGQNQLK